MSAGYILAKKILWEGNVRDLSHITSPIIFVKSGPKLHALESAGTLSYTSSLRHPSLCLDVSPPTNEYAYLWTVKPHSIVNNVTASQITLSLRPPHGHISCHRGSACPIMYVSHQSRFHSYSILKTELRICNFLEVTIESSRLME